VGHAQAPPRARRCTLKLRLKLTLAWRDVSFFDTLESSAR
jgi:hypothetical protein